MTDNELMAALALGHTEALTELVARHRAWAESLADSLLHDKALAEDVVQEAFTRVYLLRASYQPTFAFRTYLAVIVRRLCVDQYRRRRLRPPPTDAAPEETVSSAEQAYLDKERRMQLWDLVASLPETDRALLTGFALEGASYRELAHRHGLTLAQVRIRLHRIRNRLNRERDKE